MAGESKRLGKLTAHLPLLYLNFRHFGEQDLLLVHENVCETLPTLFFSKIELPNKKL